MATILDTLKKGADYLQRHEVDEARLNMELLLGHVLKMDRMRLYLDFDSPISDAHLATLRDLTMRRGKGEPLQHLLGTVEFCGLEFLTDRRALIPRPETEELTLLLLARPWPDQLEILDLGCGSGVIGLTLAHRLSDRGARVTLADLSHEALSLARENAARLLPPGSSLRFAEGDLFAALGGERFDLIVANLPYVPCRAETTLSREVRRDPALALYGGELGTEVMERFLAESGEHLRPGGCIAMEFGIDQGPLLRRCAEDHGLDGVDLRRDIGGIERFLFAVKTPQGC
jgi:release factor glutamine methyltransferase